jgi:signal transduction histidine kinase
LIQNDRIVRRVTEAAAESQSSRLPLALLMIFGLACSLMIMLGLLYMFLRLIRAVQLNVAQSEFIAAVTHELRSPVASLQIMLETIRDPTVPPEKRREFEECMQSDLKRLRNLVDQVLDTARLETSSKKPLLEPVAVRTIVENCTNSIAARVKMASGSLRVCDIPDDLMVKANQALLTSVLNNILDNALKYSQTPVDIRLDVRDGNNSVFIAVRDSGIGIVRSEQKRIFKRFYRTTDPLSRVKPGTGLGLYFARLAIRAQGGDLSVDSPGLGFGSTFVIEVPKT